MDGTMTLADERRLVLERLSNMRTILPVFAQELAVARRQAAYLRAENARLGEEIISLRRRRAAASRAPRPKQAQDPGGGQATRTAA